MRRLRTLPLALALLAAAAPVMAVPCPADRSEIFAERVAGAEAGATAELAGRTIGLGWSFTDGHEDAAASGERTPFAAALRYAYTRYQYDGVASRNRDLHELALPFGFARRIGGLPAAVCVTPAVRASSNIVSEFDERISADDVQIDVGIEVGPAGPAGWVFGLRYDAAFGRNRAYPVVGWRGRSAAGSDWQLGFPDSWWQRRIGARQTVRWSLGPAGATWHVATDDFTDEFDYRRRALRTALAWRYDTQRGWGADVSLGLEWSRRHELVDRDGVATRLEPEDTLFARVALWRR